MLIMCLLKEHYRHGYLAIQFRLPEGDTVGGPSRPSLSERSTSMPRCRASTPHHPLPLSVPMSHHKQRPTSNCQSFSSLSLFCLLRIVAICRMVSAFSKTSRNLNMYLTVDNWSQLLLRCHFYLYFLIIFRRFLQYICLKTAVQFLWHSVFPLFMKIAVDIMPLESNAHDCSSCRQSLPDLSLDVWSSRHEHPSSRRTSEYLVRRSKNLDSIFRHIFI